MNNRYSTEAAIIAEAIKHMAETPEALENFEMYLSTHFPAWLEKYAGTPGNMAAELNMFAHMFDREV